MELVERVGVGGDRSALGQDVEPSKQAETGIEGVVAYVGVAFGSKELECQEREQITGRRDELRSRQAGGPDHVADVELGEKRCKKIDTRTGTIEAPAIQLVDRHGLQRHPQDGVALCPQDNRGRENRCSANIVQDGTETLLSQLPRIILHPGQVEAFGDDVLHAFLVDAERAEAGLEGDAAHQRS